MPDKRPPKTPKEKAFVKEYVKTLNATEAAARVYDVKDRNSANAIGAENLAKLSLDTLMDDIGLTDKRLLEVLEEGISATRASNAAILLTKDGQMIKAEEQGLIEVADYATRHKYLDTALKLKDKYPAEKHKHTGGDGGPIEHTYTDLNSWMASKLPQPSKHAKDNTE